MVNVAHLFTRKHASRAIQALKAQKWTQLGYVEFLHRVAAQKSVNQLEPDALKALFNFLPQIHNPVLRQVSLDLLDSLGSIDARAMCCASYLSSGSYEEASAYIDTRSDTASTLISLGGADQVFETILDENIAMRPALWSQLFAAYVEEEDYHRAKELWLREDRPTFKAAGEQTILKFIELIGMHSDRDMLRSFLRSSGTGGDLTLSSGAVAASLNCFSSDNRIWSILREHSDMLSRNLVLQDGRLISDALAKRASEIVQHSRDANSGITDIQANLLLQGIYRQNSSRSVLHMYRLLVEEFEFVPNSDTVQILANAAYRLGNSKLLGYAIWREATAKEVVVTRKLCETMLMCQLVGSGHRSSLFFISEMFRRGIPLRGNIQRILFSKFERAGDGPTLLELFQQRRPERLYLEFDMEVAEQESGPLGELKQAKSNADVFLHGQRSSDETDLLSEFKKMLAFDERKALGSN